MSEICKLEDLSKDCCVNCFNGLPAYGCPKQEEESNQLRELIHKKAIKKEQRIRLDERNKIINKIYPLVRNLGSSKRIDDICEKMEHLKNGKYFMR